MMNPKVTLIKGLNLTSRQREEVFRAYVNRFSAIGEGKHYADDEEWLQDHAFYYLKDGSRLSNAYKHCVPYYLADVEDNNG